VSEANNQLRLANELTTAAAYQQAAVDTANDLITRAGFLAERGGKLTYCTQPTQVVSKTDNTPVNGFGPGQSATIFRAWVLDGMPIDPTTKTYLAPGTTSGALRYGMTGHPFLDYIDSGATVVDYTTNKWIDINDSSDGTHAGPTGVVKMQAPVETHMRAVLAA